MNLRDIQLAVQAAESALNVPQEFKLETLRDYLSAERHREIVIDELEGLSGTDVCGMLFVKEDKDVILHAPTSSPLYRGQIVLHEFGHLIFKHDHTAIPIEPRMTLIPSLDLMTRGHIFLRSSFTDESDLAAELLADRLAARIINSGRSLVPEHLAFGEVFG